MKINSHLDNFVLIDKVIDINDERITTEKKFNNNESYLLLETIAQTAALHSRYLTDFKKHSFLLKFNHSDFYNGRLNGKYKISTRMITQTDSTNLYQAHLLNHDFKAELLISTLDYDDNFSAYLLKEKYSRILKCLQKK